VFNAGLADTSNKIPGGGLVSTAEDLVRFALAVERGMLLPPRQVAEMWTPGKLRSGEATAYGYGWNVATTEGVRTISHSGGQQGTRTLLVLQPERHVALALMTNCEHTDLGRLLRALLAALPR
jgi:CubicO group peptidase (beta-lactamase class C family)